MGDDGEDSKIVVIFFLRLVRLVAVLVVIGLARGGVRRRTSWLETLYRGATGCVVKRVGEENYSAGTHDYP